MGSSETGTVATTLFDASYAVKAALMVASLRESGCRWPIEALALDRDAEPMFRAALPFPFERAGVNFSALDETLATAPGGVEIARLRGERTWPMFCFTLASWWTLVNHGRASRGLAYLDADLWFLDDPEAEVARLSGDDSDEGRREREWKAVLAMPHDFGRGREWMAASSGLFNVSMVWFDVRSPRAVRLLCNWAAAVASRCDAETCGDQRHLDSWPREGGDIFGTFGRRWSLAPWNVWDREIVEGETTGRILADGEPAGMYHFHEFALIADAFRRSRGYPLRDDVEGRLIYDRYERAYLRAIERVARVGGGSR